MNIHSFKEKIISLQQRGIKFISLSTAYKKISNDFIRFNEYAVITFDDGYSSLKEIIPWLNEKNIPITLFVNPAYADGKKYRESVNESYLFRQELSELEVEIGMHGLQHIDVSEMSVDTFREYVNQSITETSRLHGYIPFWSYAWGRHNAMTDSVLKEFGIMPVLMDGMENYHDECYFHRELLK